jgi:hypothetical protein
MWKYTKTPRFQISALYLQNVPKRELLGHGKQAPEWGAIEAGNALLIVPNQNPLSWVPNQMT